MKAKLKKTGEIINIADHAMVTLDTCNSMGVIGFDEVEEFLDDNGLPLGFEKQMNTPRPIMLEPSVDWEQVRIQAAIAAMQGMMAAISPERFTVRISKEAVAKASVEYADALIEELKKKK